METRRHRTLWQWSLGQQLAAVAVLCLVASFVGVQIRARYLHSEFRSLGCEVLLVGERPLGGTKQFGVRFQGAKFDNAALARAMRIADLLRICHETVSLNSTRLSDTGVAQLCTWRDIRVVVIEGQTLSAGGLHRLQQLPNLEYLEIDGSVLVSTRR